MKIRNVFIGIVLIVTAAIEAGCFIKIFTHSPKRPFTPTDLLVTEDELPEGWVSPSGPKRDTDTRKPAGSMQINIYTLPTAEGADITQRVAIYPSIEKAKSHFSEEAQFPGETEIKGWSFTSSTADEQKFSCYKYSNLNYPICNWRARYQEILIEVNGRLEPDHLSLEEMQTIVQTIDDKVSKKLEK